MKDNSEKIILDLAGGTGSWSLPYKEAKDKEGKFLYKVIIVTLPRYDLTKHWCYGNHFIIYDPTMKYHIKVYYKDIYGVLFAPPCTKFSKANWRVKKKDRDFEEGMKIVRAGMDIIWTIQEHGAPLKFWALENPMGYMYNFLGRPVFYFQPWQFGETGFLATKRTALWGYFNQPAKTVLKRTIPFILPHSKSKGTSRENKQWYSESADRRSITPPGFAKAFYKANK
jgi:hypothetical protein